MKKFYIKDIKKYLSEEDKILGVVEGHYFTNVKTINEINSESLDWINPDNPNKQKILESSSAKIIICDKSITILDRLLNKKTFIIVKNPKLTFLRIVNELLVKKTMVGIHPTSYIHDQAEVSNDVYIGAFTYVGRSIIGSGARIFGNCYIYDDVKIGNNVTIHSGTIVGADGFGYVKNENNELEKFPHIGGVIIEDDVEIGANTCIDKGSLGNTIICSGAKIDNLVHIAHNVKVGKNSSVIANAMVAGSTEIGENAWIAPSSSILEHLKIGKASTLGVGAVVTKNVPDGETWVGSPAKELQGFIELQKKIKNL